MEKVIETLSWLLVKEKRLLLVRSHGKRRFYLPGGKREVGESDQQALCREIQEELSVTLIEESLCYLTTVTAPADSQPEGVTVSMNCYQADYQGELQPAAEIAELAWFGYHDREKCATAAQQILTWLKQQGKIV